MKTLRSVVMFAIVMVSSHFFAADVVAHCDTLDGPVVTAAQFALRNGDVTPVLKWVTRQDENEVREAFAATMKVRGLGEDARKLADMHFFETLVRLHRAGESEPYTGLKPAGAIQPDFAASDEALRDGSVDALAAEIAKAVEDEVRRLFLEVIEKKKHADESVEAGRAYVAAYIRYTHFIGQLHTMSSGSGGQHHLHAQ